MAFTSWSLSIKDLSPPDDGVTLGESSETIPLFFVTAAGTAVALVILVAVVFAVAVAVGVEVAVDLVLGEWLIDRSGAASRCEESLKSSNCFLVPVLVPARDLPRFAFFSFSSCGGA